MVDDRVVYIGENGAAKLWSEVVEERGIVDWSGVSLCLTLLLSGLFYSLLLDEL